MNTRVFPNWLEEVLRSRVCEAVRRHWVRPHAAELLVPPGPERVEQLARTALDTMLTRQFRVGPLPSPEVYEQFLAPIRRFVAKGKLIRVIVGYAPLKNPNAVTYSRANWARKIGAVRSDKSTALALSCLHDRWTGCYPDGWFRAHRGGLAANSRRTKSRSGSRVSGLIKNDMSFA
jgi:hypothetical protein